MAGREMGGCGLGIPLVEMESTKLKLHVVLRYCVHSQDFQELIRQMSMAFLARVIYNFPCSKIRIRQKPTSKASLLYFHDPNQVIGWLQSGERLL